MHNGIHRRWYSAFLKDEVLYSTCVVNSRCCTVHELCIVEHFQDDDTLV